MPDFIPPRFPSSDFPANVLKWMKINNVNPKMAVKLMQCSKCFQHEVSQTCDEKSGFMCSHMEQQNFPYFVVKDLKYFDPETRWSFRTLDNKDHILKEKESIEKFIKNFWITEIFGLFTFIHRDFKISYLIPKIAVCDIKLLSLDYLRKITYDEFKFLTASGRVEELRLSCTAIYFENDAPVFIDTIFKCVPNIKKFYHYNGEPSIIPHDFINSSIKHFNTSKLKWISISIISFSSFQAFTNFIKQNQHIQYELKCSFNSNSTEELITLKNYVQRIIDAGITEYPPPDISFIGQSYEQRVALKSLIKLFDEQQQNRET